MSSERAVTVSISLNKWNNRKEMSQKRNFELRTVLNKLSNNMDWYVSSLCFTSSLCSIEYVYYPEFHNYYIHFISMVNNFL